MNRTQHLLVCLAEEAAEVQKAVAKALRFGLDNHYPGTVVTNRAEIVREFLHMLAVAELLEYEKTLDIRTMEGKRVVESKKAKVEEYITYARSIGVLEP